MTNSTRLIGLIMTAPLLRARRRCAARTCPCLVPTTRWMPPDISLSAVRNGR